METDTAYVCSTPESLAAWTAWEEGQRLMAAKRHQLQLDLGRRVYVNRGFGHGSTRVTGFERLEDDSTGDLVDFMGAIGALIVSSENGAHRGLIVPNLRRKVGKELEERLRDEFTSPGLELPGMSTFHVYGGAAGMYAGGPAVFESDGALYAFWPCDNAPHDETWEEIPLSTYYLAKEQKGPF